MSNLPDEDPIGHAAKFLWLFSLIPVIFGAMNFFLPKDMTGKMTPLTMSIPFIVAALIALVGVGVWKRSVPAAWVGIGLFGLAVAGVVLATILSAGKRGALLFFGVLFVWPIIKLRAAIAAIEAEKARPPTP